MSVTGTLMHTDNNRLYHEYTPQAEDLAMIETDVTGNKRSIIGEAIYDKRFKFLVFSAGLRHYRCMPGTSMQALHPSYRK